MQGICSPPMPLLTNETTSCQTRASAFPRVTQSLRPFLYFRLPLYAPVCRHWVHLRKANAYWYQWLTKWTSKRLSPYYI